MLSYRHRAAALVAVALLAGCSERTGGSATAGATSATSATAQPSSSAKAPVTRPKKIDLKGVDPCSVLSDAQRQQFNLVGSPGKVPSPTHPGTELCGIRSGDFSYGISVTAITTEGIEMYDTALQSGEATPATIAGFPAVVNRFVGVVPACFVGLDVADGQLVDLQVDGGKIPLDELCSRATKIAEAIIQTIGAG